MERRQSRTEESRVRWGLLGDSREDIKGKVDGVAAGVGGKDSLSAFQRKGTEEEKK